MACSGTSLPSAKHRRAADEIVSDKMALRVLLFAATTVSGLTTLYDLPVSNHGARVRLLLYKKGLESAVKIVSPKELGGLRSDEYKALEQTAKRETAFLTSGAIALQSSPLLQQRLGIGAPQAQAGRGAVQQGNRQDSGHQVDSGEGLRQGGRGVDFPTIAHSVRAGVSEIFAPMLKRWTT